MDIPETGVMRMLYNQHGAALWHYACRLTSDATRAEVVVQETLLRAGQCPQMVDAKERSARAWLFTVARDMISSNGSGRPQAGGSHELKAALDKTLIADAFARLPAEQRAVLRRAHYHGWTTAQISADLGIAESTVRSRLHSALRNLQQTLQEMGVAQ